MAPDLKQVSALFNDCIESIRRAPHNNLEHLVIDWLKNARCHVMRQIESQYYQLAASVNKPISQERWALDPSQSLTIFTPDLPEVMRPYTIPITNNLQELMDECGFRSSVQLITVIKNVFSINIWFPQRVTNSTHADIHSETLRIGDVLSSGTMAWFSRLLSAADTERERNSQDRPSSAGSSGGQGPLKTDGGIVDEDEDEKSWSKN